MELKTSNPALGRSVWDANVQHVGYGPTMTISGAINKAGLLMLLVAISAIWIWNQYAVNGPAAIGGYMMIGLFGGLIAGVATSFKPSWAPVTAPIYAVLEGLMLGGVSVMFETRYHGIAIRAVGLTFGTCFVMLLAYRSGLIRATQRFTVGIIAATGGIALLYFASMILGFFHVQIPGIFGSGPVGIVFSLVVTAVAALNLILDFSIIEDGAQRGAPKYMEWYGAFALMVTLIWLYLEMLRLLAKFRDSR